jgi:hypothetical protein
VSDKVAQGGVGLLGRPEQGKVGRASRRARLDRAKRSRGLAVSGRAGQGSGKHEWHCRSADRFCCLSHLHDPRHGCGWSARENGALPWQALTGPWRDGLARLCRRQSYATSVQGRISKASMAVRNSPSGSGFRWRFRLIRILDKNARGGSGKEDAKSDAPPVRPTAQERFFPRLHCPGLKRRVLSP